MLRSRRRSSPPASNGSGIGGAGIIGFSPLHREALFLRAYPDAAQLAQIRRDLCLLTASPPLPPFAELMYEQVKALKEGESVEKPIYNHVTGVFDPAETIESPNILILRGSPPLR